ncbi:MAG: alpha/beta hydrolase fold domain-containing protein [Acidobacteria bacterium]|nr:alpha/beta hydrolase fold domain-containing protein [Acidobacteriota bacterium]MDA1234842.1 alpha/beta hydrolase fold domain-containing protein [Acidobacteriota bacterium]
MTISRCRRTACRALLLTLLLTGAALAQERPEPKAPVPPPPFAPSETFNIWPGAVPDETSDRGSEFMLVERRRPFYQIANVSTPTLSVYLPDKSKATGASILVIPGGGLVRLAIEHEGYEVAKWFADRGVAAFMLKYRVPGVGRETRWKKGLQDAQRAMSIIRSRASEWNIDPNGVGAIGFSAGGEIGTRLALLKDGEHRYANVDSADNQSSTRPAFMINIYPGGLASGGFGGTPVTMREDVAAAIDDKTPPMFFAHAFPDASLNSIMMTLELKKQNVPAELHIFQDGAHGFGVRGGSLPLTQWPNLALTWMRSLGFLDAPAVRAYPGAFSKAVGSNSPLPLISDLNAKTTVNDAFKAQGRIVANSKQEVGGYKGVFSTASAQKRYKLSGPLHCTMFKMMIVQGSDHPTINLNDMGASVVETELGYIMGVDIPTKIADAEEARLASQAVVAAIDAPIQLAAHVEGKYSAADFVAANCGNKANIIIGSRFHPDDYKLDELKVSMSRNGQTIHSTTGAATKGGQWQNLMTLINQIIDQGHVIHEGDLIISGSLGPAMPAEPGKYVADYGVLGKIEFDVK